MVVAGVPWFSSMLGNLQLTFTAGGYNDAVRSSAGRYTLINLAYLLHCFSDSRVVVGLVTYGLIGVAGVVMAWRIHGKGRDRELLGLGIVATLGLLVIYHRTYDAVLLVFPLAWAVSVLWRRDAVAADWPTRVAAWGVLTCCASFMVPGQLLFLQLGERGLIPAWLGSSTIWQATVLCQHVWAILICAGLLVWHVWQEELSSRLYEGLRQGEITE
jgi:hypothetical protein